VPSFGHTEVLIKMTLLLAPRKFSVDFPTREDWSTKCVDLVAPDGLVFFTEGSLWEGRAGAGVFSDILNVMESYALSSHGTVFQSEVYAILACLEYCVSEGIVNRAISIFSDSRAALLALKSYAVSPRVVLQCRDSLQGLALSNRVRLVWVPGHFGIHENEQADALARAGSSYAFVGPEPCLPLALSSVKQRGREWLLKSHCASWRLETACLQSRMWLKKNNPGLTRYLLRLPRWGFW
jgi:ribonuclease HI